MQRLTPIFALTLVLTTGTLLAQQNDGTVPGEQPAGQPTASPSPTDQAGAADFFADLNKNLALNFIHHLNISEIQQGQLALSRAQSDQARQFAQALVNDHQQNDQRLQDLAIQEDVILLGYQASTYDFALLNGLQALPFAQFDQIFAQLSAQEHAAATQDLERMSGPVQDPEVQAYIAQKIAELQAHEQQATALASGALQPSPSPSPSPSPAETGGQQPGEAGGEDDESGVDENGGSAGENEVDGAP